MNCRKYRVAFPLFLTGLLAAAAFGQYESSYRGDMRTAREMESHSTGTPEWKNPPAFKKDVFTFVRIKYTRGRRGWGSAGYWITDAPDSDLNLSFRLQQMTSMKVDPDGRFLELTDPELFNYPFVYMTGHGNVIFSDQDVKNLRQYLTNGGFLHIDDNYGLDKFIRPQMKKVFPELSFVELPANHTIYNQKFKFPGGLPKIHEHDNKRPQGFALIYKGRVVCYYTFECDLGNGWEDFGTYPEDSQETRGKALKMGANLVQYALTQ